MRKILKWIPIESLIFGLALAGILLVPEQEIPFGLWTVLAGLSFLLLAGLQYWQKRSITQFENGLVMSIVFCLTAGLVLLIDQGYFWPGIICGLVLALTIGWIFEIKKNKA